MANRSDNFNRADSLNSLGTPSDGGSAWTVLTSSFFGVTANAAYVRVSSGGHDSAVLDASAADVTIQATIATLSNEMGILARATDGLNNLLLRIDSGIGYDLFKRVAGSSTNIGSYSTTPASGDVVQCVLSGSSIKVYVNGTLRIAATDAFNSTATKHGLWGYTPASSGRWDDFSIVDPGAAVGFQQQMLLLGMGA